jgi:uncharacterized protein (DUF58 family)
LSTSDAHTNLLDPDVLARVEGLSLAARRIVEGYVTGAHRSPFHGFSVEFAEHREYVPGDDLRYVDWKVFGKSDRIYLKQFEEETNFACHFVLDASESMKYGSKAGGPSKLEYSKLLVAALSCLVLRQQDAAGLATFDSRVRQIVRAAGHASHLKQLCHVLETTEPAGETALGPILHDVAERISRRGLVVVASDLFDDPASVELGLKHLRHKRHDVAVLHVIDPAEEDFDFRELTLFRGLEAVPPKLVDARALRDAYRGEFQRFLHATERICRDLRFEYVRIRTDQPVEAALRAFLTGRAR